MKRTLWLGGLFLAVAAPLLRAQTPATPPPAQAASAPDSGLDGGLFYQLLLGEMNTQLGEPGAGFSLVLDAARKTGSEQLFQRAVDIALQSRSGDAALQAARAWKQALPQSRDANRYQLQILIALNRVADSAEPLRQELANAPPQVLLAAIGAIPRTYARVSDKKLAATVVERALQEQLDSPVTGAAAWTAVGRLRQAAGDSIGALHAAQRGAAATPGAEDPVLLAIELVSPKLPQAETFVKSQLESKPSTALRIAYARALIDDQRYGDAMQQAQIGTREQPDRADSWLILGVLQAQENQHDAGEKSLLRFIELAKKLPPEERQRGQAQAFLGLAQIAEKRRNFAAAESWLGKIENPQDLAGAQYRRASILAKQGKLAEGRQLLRALPQRTPAESRQKLLSEVQLLRDNKQYQAAHDLLAPAVALDPKDTDLVYDLALLAEKTGAFEQMERLLRQVMADRPDSQYAYNALGYSMAERNVRLGEAKKLIQKAVELAPADPFIRDSLGWVEFRLGNKEEALRVLEKAFKARPDAEIAAHLGEVLWSMGQRDRATSIWREGLLLNADNETLVEVLKRLRVTP